MWKRVLGHRYLRIKREDTSAFQDRGLFPTKKLAVAPNIEHGGFANRENFSFFCKLSKQFKLGTYDQLQVFT